MEVFSLQQKIIDEVNKQIDPHWLLRQINYYPEKAQTVFETLKCFCPLHKETKFRSLIIDTNNKTYRCTMKTCPGYDGGTLVGLYARIHNISQLHASLNIASELNLEINDQPLHELSQEYLSQAKEKIHVEQLPQATGLLEKAIELEPQNLEANQLLADILVKHEEIDRAIEIYLKLSTIFSDQGDVGKAVAILTDNVLKLNHGNEEAMFRLSRFYEELDEKEKALEWYLKLAAKREGEDRAHENLDLYQKILTIEPEHADARKRLALVYEEQGNEDAAVQQYWELGQMLAEKEAYPSAIEVLSRLKNLRPDHIEARKLLIDLSSRLGDSSTEEKELLELSRLLLSKGEFKRAKPLIDRILKINPNSLAGRETLLDMLIHNKQTKKALVQIKELYAHYSELDQEQNSLSILLKGKEISPEDTEIREMLFNLYCEIGENVKAVDEGMSLAELHLKNDSIPHAEKVFNQILGLAPQDSLLQEQVAQHYLSHNHVDKAALHLGEAAKICVSQGNVDRALEFIDQALSHSPENRDLLQLKAEISMQTGKTDEAVGVYCSLAKILVTQDEIQEAEQLLNLAIKKLPSSEPLYLDLADLYKQSGRTAEAAQTLRQLMQVTRQAENLERLIQIGEEVIALDAGDVDTLMLIADARTQTGEEELAVDYYKKSADLLFEKEEFAGAQAALDKAVEIAPHNPDLLFLSASLTYESGNIDEAIPLFEKALKLFEESGAPQKEVITHYEKVLSKDPSLDGIRRKFIEFLFSVGNKQEAVKQLYELAEFYHNVANDLNAAIATYLDIKEHDPKNPALYEDIAELYEKENDKNNAAQFYWSAAQIFIEQGEQPTALEKLKKLIILKPEDESALEQLASLSKELEDNKSAIKFYNQLASLRQSQGRKEENELVYNNILEIAPESTEIREQLAHLLKGKGEHQRAAKEFLLLGEAAIRNNKLKPAVDYLNQCLKLAPLMVEAIDKLVDLYTRLDQTDKALSTLLQSAEKAQESNEFDIARTFFARLKELAPQNPQVSRKFAEFLISSGATDDAINELNHLVQVYSSQGDLSHASEVLQRLKKLQPENEETRRKLADIYLRLDADDKAAAEWGELINVILERSPSAKEINKALDDAFDYIYAYPEISLSIADRLTQIGKQQKGLEYLLKVSSHLTEHKKYEAAYKNLEYVLTHESENVDALIIAVKVTHNLGDISQKRVYLKRLGCKYFDQHDFKSAAEVLDKANQIESGDSEILHHLGESLLQLGQKEKAQQILFQLSGLYQQAGDIQNAVSTAERIIEFDPDNINVLRHLSELYLLSNDEESAYASFSHIADILESKGALEEALTILDRIISFRPDDKDVIRRQIVLIARTEGIEAARPRVQDLIEIVLRTSDSPVVIEEYRWAINQDEGNMPLRITFANYLDKIGKPEEARNELITIAEIFDKRLGNTKKAIEILEKAKKLGPSDLSLMEKIGYLYAKVGDGENATPNLMAAAKGLVEKHEVDKSMRLYKKVIEINPQEEQAYFDLADIFEKQEKDSDAVDVYISLMEQRKAENREKDNIPVMVKILEIDPGRIGLRRELAEHFAEDNIVADATFHFSLLGEQFESEKRLDEAITIYNRIKEVDADNITARERLADIFLEHDDKDAAKAELHQLSEIAFSSGDNEGARKYIVRITKIDPDDIEAGERLAAIYQEEGEIDLACEEYIRLSDRFSESGEPDKALEMLNRVKNLAPQDLFVRKKIIDLLLAQQALSEAAEEELSLAKILFSREKKEEALEHCRRVREIVRDSTELIIKTCEVLIQNDLNDEASAEYDAACHFFAQDDDFTNVLRLCDNALSYFAENETIRLHRVEALIQLEKSEEAVAECFQLAGIYKRADSSQKAEQMLIRVLTLDPENIAALQGLTDLKVDEGSKDEAIDYLVKIIHIYQQKAKFEEAQEHCLKALELDDKNHNLHRMLAGIYTSQNNIQKAVQEYFTLANIVLDEGDLQEARNLFTTILEIDEHNLDALLMLRNILAQTGQTREFIRISNRLLDLYGEQGAITEAIEMAEGIRDSEPDNLPIRYRLARYYEKDGRSEDAIAIYQQLAEQFEAEQNYKQAIEERLRIKSILPKSVSNLKGLADLYDKIGDKEKACEDLLTLAEIFLKEQNDPASSLEVAERVIIYEPENYDAHKIVAEDYKLLQKPAKAADEFSRLARYSETRNDIEAAIIYLEEALELVPSLFKERERIVRLLKQTGQEDRAVEHLFALAHLYEENNRIEDAATAFEIILESNPENLYAHQRLFEVYRFLEKKDQAVEQISWLVDFHLQKNDLDKAEKLLEEGITIDPESIELRESLANLLEKQGRMENASRHLLKIAELHLMQGNIDVAIESLEKVKRYSPDNIETHRSLAMLYQHKNRTRDYANELLSVINLMLEQGLVEDAEKYVDDLINNIPDMPHIREEIADLYLQHNIPEMAVRLFLQLSELYLENKKIDEAKKILARVIEFDSQNYTAREILLDIALSERDIPSIRSTVEELNTLYRASGKLDTLVLTFKKIVDSFPDDVDFRGQLAALLEESEHTTDAITQWREVASVFVKQDKLEEAAKVYKHVTDIAPDDTNSILNYIDIYSRIGAELDLIDDYLVLAGKYCKKGAFHEADQTYQRLLKIAPDDLRVLEHYTKFLLQRKDIDKLLPHIERLTDIYMEKGELRNAERILNKIIDITPESPALHLKLADVLLSMNARGRAVRELQCASELFAKSEDPENAVSTLRKIVTISPQDTNTRQRLIEELVELNRNDEAVTESFALADLFIKRGFLDLAEIEYRRIIYLEPTNYPAWNYLFDTHLQLGPEDELIDDYLQLASIYEQEGLPEEAAKIYKKLIAIQSENIEFYSNYIDIYLQFGVETDLIDEYLDLAELYMKEGNQEDAARIYKKVLSLQPENKSATERIAEFNVDEEELDLVEPDGAKEGDIPAAATGEEPETVMDETLQDAIKNYKAILELNPENAIARCKLADIFDQLNQPNEAYAQRSQAAQVLINKGELDKGIDLCEKQLQVNPNDAEIRQILNNAVLQRDSFKAIESAIEYIEKQKTES